MTGRRVDGQPPVRDLETNARALAEGRWQLARRGMQRQYSQLFGSGSAKLLTCLLIKGPMYGSELARAARVVQGNAVVHLRELRSMGLALEGEPTRRPEKRHGGQWVHVWALTEAGRSLAALLIQAERDLHSPTGGAAGLLRSWWPTTPVVAPVPVALSDKRPNREYWTTGKVPKD